MLRASSFKLWINGERIPLEPLVHWHAYFVSEQGTFEDKVMVSYYVQLEVNHFSASDAQFKARAPYPWLVAKQTLLREFQTVSSV